MIFYLSRSHRNHKDAPRRRRTKSKISIGWQQWRVSFTTAAFRWLARLRVVVATSVISVNYQPLVSDWRRVVRSAFCLRSAHALQFTAIVRFSCHSQSTRQYPRDTRFFIERSRRFRSSYRRQVGHAVTPFVPRVRERAGSGKRPSCPAQRDVMSFVQVSETNDGGGGGDAEVVDLPLEADSTLLLSTLHAQYPDACGLKYVAPDNGRTRAVRLADNKLHPPSGDDGWGDVVYFCSFNKGNCRCCAVRTRLLEPFRCENVV